MRSGARAILGLRSGRPCTRRLGASLLSAERGSTGIVRFYATQPSGGRGPSQPQSGSAGQRGSWQQNKQQQQQSRPQSFTGATGGRGGSAGASRGGAVGWIRQRGVQGAKPQGRMSRQQEAAPIRKRQIVYVNDTLSAKNLSALLHVRTVDILKELIKMNLCPRHSEDILEREVVDMVCELFGKIPNRDRKTQFDRLPRPVPEDTSALPGRPPVVAIMGHIDHGKTTLLDHIRNSRIAAQEHGGITQKMAAFSVHVESVGSDITFIDTPGHAAFETMRKRGASATDICILVVAADDGVQEQTLEAIKHINEADCGMIVAINKIDKKGADVARTKRQLTAAGIQFEDAGGEVPVVEISGLKGTGVEKLLETIAIWAGDMDLRADRAGEAEAPILDTRRDDWRGLSASVIPRIGTLKVGDAFVAGYTYGEIKAIMDSNGKVIQEAIPGQPVHVYGFLGNPPEPGDDLMVVKDVEMAEKIARFRFEDDMSVEGEKDKIQRVKEEMDERERVLQDRLKAIELGEDPDAYVEEQKRQREALKPKEVPVFVNADVGGSLEAVQEALSRFADNEVKIRVVRATVGPITELEIQEAAFAEPKAIIVGFNVPLSAKLQDEAKKIGVLVNSFKIIYGLTDWVKLVLSKLLRPETETTVTAEAQVLQLFTITQHKRVYNVAGCVVTSGTFKRGKKVQLVRAGNVVWEGPVRNLKHVKQDVNAVQAGKECGILLDEEVTDVQVGDLIRTVEKKQVSREIEVNETKDNSQSGVLRM